MRHPPGQQRLGIYDCHSIMKIWLLCLKSKEKKMRYLYQIEHILRFEMRDWTKWAWYTHKIRILGCKLWSIVSFTHRCGSGSMAGSTGKSHQHQRPRCPSHSLLEILFGDSFLHRRLLLANPKGTAIPPCTRPQISRTVWALSIPAYKAVHVTYL